MAGGMILTLWVAALLAAPKPALVPGPGIWQLGLELRSQPQRISILLPGDCQPRSYWYLLYTVTNNTSHDVEFYPEVQLLTDTLKTYYSGATVRRLVFEEIRKRYATNLPLLEPENNLVGRMLQGEDNARDSVAIFEDFDPNATSVKIFFAGLSNETATIDIPGVKDPSIQPVFARGFDEAGSPKKALLRKTLMLKYQVMGDKYNLDKRVLLYRGREWIMR